MAKENRKRLFLIDGAALAYRTYFALANRPLINSKGLNTSSVFGFAQTLIKIIEQERPDYLAVTFDSREPTFRHEVYTEYKATREKMPDELGDQIPYIEKVVRAMKIPYLTQPGFEADDIIGTIVTTVQNEADDCDCYIVSGDKDFMQLINDHVFLYAPGKAKEPPTISGAAAVHEKFGVKPNQVVDVLALMGDSSDNVPGVPGIGPKTASQLIQEHGSVDNLIAKVETDKLDNPKLLEKLRTNLELLKLSKELVTIHTELKNGWKLENLAARPWQSAELAELFRELEFRNLEAKAYGKNSMNFSAKTVEAESIDETSGDTGISADDQQQIIALPRSLNPKYHLIDDLEALQKLLQQLKNVDLLAIDTETTSLEFFKAELVGLSLCWKSAEAYYINLRDHPEWLHQHLKPLLESPLPLKGGHNIKYDLLVLRQHGIEVAGVSFDSMLESYLLDATLRQHNLDHLALRHFQHQKITIEELIGKGKDKVTMEQVDPNVVSQYACEDADYTLRLHQTFSPEISKLKLEDIYKNLELPLLTILFEMEYEGIKLDVDFLKILSKKLELRAQELIKTVHQIAGEEFNIQSPKQLGDILFEKLAIHKGSKFKPKKTKTGYSTDISVLEQLMPHPLIAAMIEYRNVAKLKSTYTDTLPELIDSKTGKIHTSFNQTVAATGRLSSSDPNLQNIPIRTELGREIRKAFIANDAQTVLISADYSQVELRILAHLSQDRQLINFFKSDQDIHSQTAKTIFKLSDAQLDSTYRSRAKAINFGILYGMGPQRLAKETGVTMEEAESFIDSYFRSFPKVGAYIEMSKQFARDHGYVETMLKRRRTLPEIHSNNPRLKAEAERIAVNTPIQGSAADLIKLAMIHLHERLNKEKLPAKLILQVHDELVLTCATAKVEKVCEVVKESMQQAMQLAVPLKVEIGFGKNWLEAH